jgi:PAS domain S-box-containing protein
VDPPEGAVASRFLQMLPIAAYRATLDGVIVEGNAAFRALLEVDEAAGLDLAVLLGQEVRDRALAVLKRHGVSDDETASVVAPFRHLRHRAWRVNGSEFIEGILEEPTTQGGLSADRFRRTFGRGSVPMVLADPVSQRFIAVNDAMCRFIGYSEAELLQLRLPEISDPDDWHASLGDFEAMIRGDSDVFEAEKRYVRADGSQVWGAVTVTLVGDGTGAPIRSLARIQDISGRKAAEADAHFKEAVLEHIGTAVVVTDISGLISYWSPGAEQLYQWDSAQAIGRPLNELIIPEENFEEAAELMDFIRSGGRWNDEFLQVRRDGSRFVAQVFIRVVTDPSGRPTGTVGVAYDLTDRKAVERGLRDLAAAKDEFIASISHELRTPLTAVIGFAELLRELAAEVLSTDAVEMAEAIVQESNDLAYIVDDLLVAARSTVDKMSVLQEVVDLRDLIERVSSTLGFGYASTGSQGLVVGDAARIRQIVRNLLVNARKYGSPPIGVSVEEAGDMVRLVVVDHGLGIDPTHIDTIFHPYWRERRLEHASTTGLGLGLPISRLLAEAMGGSIEYSRDGDETRFTLTLPVADLGQPPGNASPTPRVVAAAPTEQGDEEGDDEQQTEDETKGVVVAGAVLEDLDAVVE